MDLITIVEDYVNAAMRQASLEVLEDGSLVAWVPGLEGVVATGADRHECAEGLYRRLEEWVKVGLARGIRLPVFDGIDLNSDVSRTLATYHPDRLQSARSTGREFFADTEQFKKALSEHRHRE